jgi:hypothetical protein
MYSIRGFQYWHSSNLASKEPKYAHIHLVLEYGTLCNGRGPLSQGPHLKCEVLGYILGALMVCKIPHSWLRGKSVLFRYLKKNSFFWEFGGNWSPISFTYDYNNLMAWKELWIYGMYYSN